MNNLLLFLVAQQANFKTKLAIRQCNKYQLERIKVYIDKDTVYMISEEKLVTIGAGMTYIEEVETWGLYKTPKRARKKCYEMKLAHFGNNDFEKVINTYYDDMTTERLWKIERLILEYNKYKNKKILKTFVNGDEYMDRYVDYLLEYIYSYRYVIIKKNIS